MRIGGFIATSLLMLSSFALQATQSPAEELWTKEVEPILDRHCFKCHGGVRQKGGLDLRSLETILKGGDEGSAIVPGQPEQSHLVRFVIPGADPHMPPDEKKQLNEEEIAVLRKWVAKLPKVKTGKDNPPLTNGLWVADYMAALKQANKPSWVPPTNTPSHEVIDGFVRRGWKERKLKPAPLCNDRAFVRRIYLDLAGRIPTIAEADAFLADQRKDRRAKLVDQLLNQDDYAVHLREIFDVVLMGRKGDGAERQRVEHQWFQFLETSFAENRPWNQIVHDLIVARPSTNQGRGSAWYLYERKDSHQAMAEAIAPIAFGVQVKCAQCHNHPLAWEIEQRHYWGLVAAFNRSKNVNTDTGIGLSESATGGFVKFANLKKESQPALLAFPNGKSVSEKVPADDEKEMDTPELYRIPPPKEKQKPAQPAVPNFSRREALADAVTQGNPLLARAFVNRVWAMLMGRGLVHPVDQIDSRHRPSHPDLLDWLAKDFETSHYDIKHLIRSIVLSRAYQLDSRWPRKSPAPPEAFAHALDKPLSAEQLYRSLMIATGNQASPDGKVQNLNTNEIRRSITAKFPDLFSTEYNASLQQAMFLSNSPLLDELLKARPGSTTAQLVELKSTDDRVRQAFLITLGRLPDKEEQAQTRSYLDQRTPEAGTKQLLWALLTSAEFQLNH